ncbi:aminotransferase class I/II-fold pyridoxal phosphate-dependent enzyme [candidate division KSB1 bacterium]|nr:MAG: aminotransferase class I/II-fold pyridoxal phosphate-dependent enzyme [candidate division KSB1 bacterium]
MTNSTLPYASRLSALPPYLFADLEKKTAEKIAAGRDVINLGIGDPDLPPPGYFTRSLQMHVADPDAHFYPTSRGDPDVRKAIARFFKGRFGVDLDPESQICVVLGGKEGLSSLGRAYVNPGDIVAVPSPAYPVYAQGITALCDAQTQVMPLKSENGFLPDLNLAEGVRALFVNYPNNPTGAVATEFFWEQLADFADTHPETLVCHDHAYSEMTFGDYIAPSLLQYTKNCVEMHSLSKVFNATGFRIGFAAGRADIISGMVRVKTQIDSGAPLFIQRAMADGLLSYRGTEPPPEVEKIRRVYGERRVYAEKALALLGLDVTHSEATFYVWVRVGDDEMPFVERALDHDVVVTPGRGFGAEGIGYIRLALTQPLPRIEEALHRLV